MNMVEKNPRENYGLSLYNSWKASMMIKATTHLSLRLNVQSQIKP